MKHNYTLLNLLLTIFISLIYSNTFCQSAEWKWARNALGDSFDQASTVATDLNGNVYVAGYFASDSIIFGSIKLYNSEIGFDDMFIVKYDSTGKVIWAKSAGGSSDDKAFSVTVDKNNNVYLTGYFYSPSITFATYTLNNAGNVGDIFIVKYDPDGNIVWARRDGGPGLEIPYTITSDISGNIIVAGRFSSQSITFGTTTLTQRGSMDIFVVKYDSEGNVKWAKGAGGSSNDEAYSAITDASKNIFVCGYFNQNATFETTTLTTAGSADMFLAKYDSTGTLKWVKKAGGDNDDRANAISLDDSGNIYAAGYFASTSINFGTTNLTNNYNEGIENAFIAKFDNEGNAVWAHGLNGKSKALSIATTEGKVYSCGTFKDDNLNYGTSTLVLKGSLDFFLLHSDDEGNSKQVFYQTSGGESSELANSIATDTKGNVYVAGNFNSHPIAFGNSVLNTSDGFDMFVAKMGATQTGITELQNQSDFIIYPNPGKGQIYLQGDISIKGIDIYEMNGIRIFSQQHIKQYESNIINIPSVTAGIYYIRIFTKEYSVLKKLIIL